MARLPMVLLLVAAFLPMFCSRASKLLRSRWLALGNLLATPSQSSPRESKQQKEIGTYRERVRKH